MNYIKGCSPDNGVLWNAGGSVQLAILHWGSFASMLVSPLNWPPQHKRAGMNDHDGYQISFNFSKSILCWLLPELFTLHCIIVYNLLYVHVDLDLAFTFALNKKTTRTAHANQHIWRKSSSSGVWFQIISDHILYLRNLGTPPKKTNGIFWEFFPNVGPPPSPLLGKISQKYRLFFCWHY